VQMDLTELLGPQEQLALKELLGQLGPLAALVEQELQAMTARMAQQEQLDQLEPMAQLERREQLARQEAAELRYSLRQRIHQAHELSVRSIRIRRVIT